MFAPVCVLSEIDSLQAPLIKARVLFKTNGATQDRLIEMRRPTYFQKIVTVSVDEISSPPSQSEITIKSWKDVIRKVYRGICDLDGKYGSSLKFEGLFFDTRATEPRNVALLLTHIIPLCLHVRLHCPKVEFVFNRMGDVNSPYQRLLAAFEIQPIVTHKRIEGSRVHVRGTRGLSAFNVQDTFDCAPITFLPGIYEGYKITGKVGHDKIFLARRDYRSLNNQADVERLVNANGYKTIYMEDYSIEDQISIGANAKHVIATHGAAMAFLVFNREIESIVELSPPHVYHEFFPVTLGNRVKKYTLIVQEFDARIIHQGWNAILHFKNKPFSADMDLLSQSLNI
jgi:hypothetical protein